MINAFVPYNYSVFLKPIGPFAFIEEAKSEKNFLHSPHFFIKFLVGDLLSGTIFSPHRGQSRAGEGLVLGTESDEGGLEKIVR